MKLSNLSRLTHRWRSISGLLPITDIEGLEPLHATVHRSHLIDRIHGRVGFNDHFKVWVFLPAGMVVTTSVITRLNLFLLFYLA